MFNLNNNQINNLNYGNNQPANHIEYSAQAIRENNRISNEKIINKFLIKFHEIEDYAKKNRQEEDMKQMEIYTNLSLNLLENLETTEENKQTITDKICQNLDEFMIAEDDRHYADRTGIRLLSDHEYQYKRYKKIMKECEKLKSFCRYGIQLACFYIYLCEQNVIDNDSKIKIMEELKTKKIEDLYNDFYNFLEKLSKNTKELILTATEFLDFKMPEKKANSEEIKKEILENLEHIKIGSDENNSLYGIDTLNSEITNLINKFLNNKVDKNINDKIKSNITNCYGKIEKNPKLKTSIIAGLKLIYACLYLRYKDIIKDDNLLKAISENNIEDLLYKYDKIFSQYDYENEDIEDIIKSIKEEIIKSMKEELAQRDDSHILEKFKSEIEKGPKDFYPSLDILGVYNLNRIKETFEFYKQKSIEILFDSPSLDENIKNKLSDKIVNIDIPKNNQLGDETYEKEKMYAIAMKIICFCLYLYQQSDKEERNKEMLDKILKYDDITKLNDDADEIFEDVEDNVKEKIFEKLDLTPVHENNKINDSIDNNINNMSINDIILENNINEIKNNLDNIMDNNNKININNMSINDIILDNNINEIKNNLDNSINNNRKNDNINNNKKNDNINNNINDVMNKNINVINNNLDNIIDNNNKININNNEINNNIPEDEIYNKILDSKLLDSMLENEINEDIFNDNEINEDIFNNNEINNNINDGKINYPEF